MPAAKKPASRPASKKRAAPTRKVTKKPAKKPGSNGSPIKLAGEAKDEFLMALTDVCSAAVRLSPTDETWKLAKKGVMDKEALVQFFADLEYEFDCWHEMLGNLRAELAEHGVSVDIPF